MGERASKHTDAATTENPANRAEAPAELGAGPWISPELVRLEVKAITAAGGANKADGKGVAKS